MPKPTASTLDLMSLPAVILSSGGRVMAINQRLERMDTVFLPVAHGGLAIADRDANRLFQDAVGGMSGNAATARSIPMLATGGGAAFVIYLLPLRRAAHDIFAGADILMLATPITPSALVPSTNLLNALFDFTPAEARLATDLASGLTLSESAARRGLTTRSARTCLERVFHKTGTHQQSQVVAMIKTVQPIVASLEE